ncbi:hypothetical protein ACFQ2Y_05275 [Streptomyces malaysiensis subsp. malaysiensis]
MSWRVILEDLDSAYRRAARDEGAGLPRSPPRCGAGHCG